MVTITSSGAKPISERAFISATDTMEAYLEGMPGLTAKQIDTAIEMARAYLEQRIEKCLAKVECKGLRNQGPKGGAR